MPFRRLAEHIGTDAAPGHAPVDRDYLDRVSYAVNAAANNVPWRSDCFPRAIAAHKLLSKRGYATTIHLGVEKNSDSGIAAHAWLTCADVVVTGGEDVDRYTEMMTISA